MDTKQIEEGEQLTPQFQKRGGIIPVIVQDTKTKDILMLGYANQEAFEETLKTKMASFWSTSRNELWVKGKTSGDYLKVVEIAIDCDQDALIYHVEMMGNGVCHTKSKKGKARKSCFYRKVDYTTLRLIKNEQ